MRITLAWAALIVALGSAAPALAGTSSAIPEPSTMMLFGLGVAGLIIGRQSGRRPRD